MKLLLWTWLLVHGLAVAAELECSPQGVSSDNPMFPAVKVYQSVICDPRPTNPKLISSFEYLLTHRSFRLPIMQEGDTFSLNIGTTGSFSVWRDLINFNLGRAYYEEGELTKAISYWTSIVAPSPYHPLAVLEANYARFKLNQWDLAQKELISLQNIDDIKLQKEMRLQEAFIALRLGKLEEASEMADSLKFHSEELEILRQTVLAEALFSRYLSQYTGLAFKDKIKTLKRITDAVDNIPAHKRSGDLIYLAAEAYWHTGVAYRIEEPQKYETVWKKQLEVADSWVSTSVNSSIKTGKAQLSEEAFFFSIALLWEREAHEDALIRLKSLDRLYPHGVYREDAYQLLGDYYFDRQEFGQAIPYYRKLAQVGSESKAAYGVYKAAWSFYNDKDKWKSLRHFQRLFQFYLGKKGQDLQDKHELKKEARQDLLLVISEMLPSAKAIDELKSFKQSEEDARNMINDLAKLYQRNGNYSESVLTWTYLLQQHLENKEAHNWIIELAKDLYADGKRDEISHKIREHYSIWKKKHFHSEHDKEFAKEWSRIILSLHREAKKSEDPLFWKATDLAYEAYESMRPSGQEGEVWYFGAQKFQSQGQLWRSIEWFKRAADVKGYESADDAALSALGLLNDRSGNLSIIEDKEKHIAEYKKLAFYTEWFFKRDSDKLKKQKELAHFLHAEALFFTGEHMKSRGFLSQLFNDSSLNEETWNVYLSHNKRLYQSQNWEEAYHLALTLQKTKLGEQKDKIRILANVAQENAFQLAFQGENKKPNDVSFSRHWYKEAFTLPHADEKLMIKAWHNYLISFTPEEAVDFEKQLEQFVRRWEGKAPADAELEELQFNIFAKALKVFDAAKIPSKKSRYLHLASKHTDNKQLQESLLWDALVIHANYHQWRELRHKLSELKEIEAPLLSNPKYQAILAKYFYLEGEVKDSWAMLQPLLSFKDVPAASWLLLYDLHVQGDVRDQVEEFLRQNEKELSTVAWLRPLWANLKEKDYLANIKIHQIEITRAPANINEADSPEIQAFKERIARMANIYSEMNFKKQILQKAVLPEAPATATDAICKASPVTKEAYQSLQSLRKDPIKSEQWGQFLSRLDEKDAELLSLMKREEENCEKAKDDTVFIGGFKHEASPFCKKIGCLRKKEISTDEIISLENKESSSTDAFISYLYHGAWARAEALAAEEKNPQLQSYLYALLRLAADDVWNATILLEELGKSKKWAPKVQYLKALIAEKRERHQLAKKLAPNDVDLSSWEKRLFALK